MTGENSSIGEEPVRVALCTPQISRGLARDRIWASAMRNRQLTARKPRRGQAHIKQQHSGTAASLSKDSSFFRTVVSQTAASFHGV